TVTPGFLLAAEAPFTEMLSTGTAPWQAKVVEGYSFLPPFMGGAAALAGGTIAIDGRAYPWGVEHGEGEGWIDVAVSGRARDRVDQWGEYRTPRLEAGTLPAMLDRPWRGGVVRHIDEPSAETDLR